MIKKVFVFALIYLTLIINILEFANYDNFVYSHYRIRLELLNLFTGLVVVLVYLHTKSHKSWLIHFALLISLVYGLAGTFRVLGKSLSNLYLWSKSPYSLTQRIERTKYGGDLKYINFIKRSIPDYSIILIPPITPGKTHTSDYWFMSALLYPRRIVQFATEQDLTKVNYVLITSEADNDRPESTWPGFEVPDGQITIYDWQNDSAINMPKINTPTPWGYISINR